MASLALLRDDPAPSAPASLSARGEAPRIRFLALRAHRPPSGQCRAEVELERIDGTRVVGVATGQSIALGDLRIAAEATVAALHLATTTGHRFELVGVKAIRAFDQTVVLVQITVAAGPGPGRLVGAAFGDVDVTRAAVLAVLNATNRVLWNPGEA